VALPDSYRARGGAPVVSAGKVLGYIVAERHRDGSLSVDYTGPTCDTPDDARAWCTEPGDIVVSVCEVTVP